MKVIGIIPSRMGSSRFPGKPLAKICNLSMIEHVYKRSALASVLSDLYVATCDSEIEQAVKAFGGKVIMTSPDHTRCTDRVAEAAKNIDADVVVNIQGDEPLLHPDMIQEVSQPLLDDSSLMCSCLMKKIPDEASTRNPNVVKVVCDQSSNALYFSRQPIPTSSPKKSFPSFKQIGILAFRRPYLLEVSSQEETPLEQAESVDLMRVLENGQKIRMVDSSYDSIGVDHPGDVTNVEELMKADKLFVRYADKGKLMPILAKRNLEVGIIGYGKMGKIRADVVRRHPNLNLSVICDPTAPEALPKDCDFIQDHQKILSRNLDAIVICTPNAWNARLAAQALKSGKHVFCEKPPARNTQELQEILAAEQAHPNLKLKFGFNHRYHDGVMEAKALIDRKHLGRILWIRGVYGKAGGAGFEDSWRNKGQISGGGILLDQGIHMVDLFRHLCGDFSDVKSFISKAFWNVDVEDNAFALLRTPSGQVGMLHSSSTHWKQRFSIEIFLEKGYVAINGILSKSKGYGRETLVVAQKDESGNIIPNPREEVTYFDQDHSWQREMDDFVESILTDEPVRIGNSEDAVKTLSLVEKIYHSDPSWKVPLLGPAPKEFPRETTQVEEIESTQKPSPMRHVVVSDELRETQVHPKGLFEEYLELSKKDVVNFFDSSLLVKRPCPICESSDQKEAFKKWELIYQECQSCKTVYLSPMPSSEQLKKFRDISASSRFWRSRFLGGGAEARDEKMFGPRLQWMSALCAENFKGSPDYADFGSKYKTLLSSLGKSSPFGNKKAIFPNSDLIETCKNNKFDPIETQDEARHLKENIDMLTAFEVINETADPLALLNSAKQWLRPGGLLLITGKTISGLDLQVLWGQSRNVHPIDHSVLPSLDGLTQSIEKNGFELLEVSTPGQLDLEMIERTLESDPTIPVPRFLKELIQNRSEEDRQNFRDFLQRSRMSSYMRIAARKL